MMRSSVPHGPRRRVERALVASNLVIGAVAVAGGVAAPYLFWRMGRMPIWLLVLAVLVLAGGLRLLARPFGDVCVCCRRALKLVAVRLPAEVMRLATSAIKAGDAAAAVEAIGSSTGDAGEWAELRYCPRCRAVAVWNAGGTSSALTDECAASLIERLVPSPTGVGEE